MNIGDRVRVLHGTEEGIIKRLIDSRTVEIEIDEGFTFPVLVSDLVQIGDQEEKYFIDDKTVPDKEKKIDKSELYATKGIFIALEHDEESKKYKLHIINNTDTQLLAGIFRKEKKLTYSGIFSGKLNARQHMLFIEVNEHGISKFNELYCQFLQVNPEPGPLKDPIGRQIRLSQLLAKKKSDEAPVIKRPAWIKQVDDELSKPLEFKQIQKVNPDYIPPQQIDLHAESLNIKEGTPPPEILEEQIRTFNKALDDAIIYGHPEITFIHGVGQGTLKERIIKEIQKRNDIKYWEDAQKEKFGFGATKIVL